MQKIKDLLVGLDEVIDNTYLDQYCHLIKEAEYQRQEPFKTAKHHIIPVCYFKCRYDCKTRKEAMLFANAAPNRIVHLTHDQHIMAHYYLSLCTSGKLHTGMINALCLMLKGVSLPVELDQIDLTVYTQLYQEFLADVSRVHKGKVVSRASKEKQSQSCRGRVSGMKGKHHTEAVKLRLAESSKGNTNSLGYKHSDESKKKMSENCTRCRAVRCVETDQVFRSASDVFNQLNIRHIAECCKNPKLTAGGYHWEYV